MKEVANPQWDWVKVEGALKNYQEAYRKKITSIQKIIEDKKLFIKFEDGTSLICSWSNYKDEISFEDSVRKMDAVDLGFYSRDQYEQDEAKYKDYCQWYEMNRRKQKYVEAIKIIKEMDDFDALVAVLKENKETDLILKLVKGLVEDKN